MNSIFMYDIAENGTATPLSINLSPSEGDGPRNSLSSKDGKLLYVVSGDPLETWLLKHC